MVGFEKLMKVGLMGCSLLERNCPYPIMYLQDAQNNSMRIMNMAIGN
jgi:hypothetical protein